LSSTMRNQYKPCHFYTLLDKVSIFKPKISVIWASFLLRVFGWSKLKAAGVVCDSDFRYLRNTGFYRGRSLVYDAYVRLFGDGAYYQRACEPIPLEFAFLLYEDLRRTLQYYTKGLAEVNGASLNDFEVGRDYAGLSLPDGVSRVIFYPKRGKVRLHVQVSEELPLPLGPEEIARIKEVFLDAIHEVHKIIDPNYAKRVKVWDELKKFGLAIRVSSKS